jgi:hypothetical protein
MPTPSRIRCFARATAGAGIALASKPPTKRAKSSEISVERSDARASCEVCRNAATFIAFS